MFIVFLEILTLLSLLVFSITWTIKLRRDMHSVLHISSTGYGQNLES